MPAIMAIHLTADDEASPFAYLRGCPSASTGQGTCFCRIGLAFGGAQHGRICLAALNSRNIDYVADAIAALLKD